MARGWSKKGRTWVLWLRIRQESKWDGKQGRWFRKSWYDSRRQAEDGMASSSFIKSGLCEGVVRRSEEGKPE